MKSWLTIKIFAVISAVVGPMPDWNTCTNYLPDFEKRADAVFATPDKLAQLTKQYPNIKRTDIVHECVESETQPELGK